MVVLPIAASALALTFASALGATQPAVSIDYPIVGGTPVDPGQWPGVIGLIAGGQLCTGTIISPTVVLGAAHCFSAARPGATIYVYSGDTFDPADPENRPLTASTTWSAHPSYCGKAGCNDDSFDYAYVVLPEDLKLTLYPQPITQQEEWDDLMVEGTDILLVGYGEDEVGKAGVKRSVWTSIKEFTPKGLQFWTSGDGKDSCRGDSGGPAFIATADNSTWRLAGVLSSGSIECGQKGYYGIPFPILDWLNKETGYQPSMSTCITPVCLDIAPKEEEKGCNVSGQRDHALFFGLFGLACLGLQRRRLRARSTPSSRLLD